MIDIKQIKQDITSLPPFRQTVLKANTLLNDPEFSVKELVNILKYDVGITTNIFKICNSAYYGVRIPVNSLQQAIVTLGHRELKKILVVSGSMQYLKQGSSGYEGEDGELLRHSAAAALLAQHLGQNLNVDPDESFVAGLLHDLGKLVLGDYVKEKYAEIIETVKREMLPFHEVERQVLGISHDEVGKIMLEYWDFPEHLIDVVENHHSFDVEKHSDLTLVVALADRMTGLLGASTFNDGMYYSGFGELCEHFALRMDDIQDLLANTAREFNDIMTVFA